MSNFEKNKDQDKGLADIEKLHADAKKRHSQRMLDKKRDKTKHLQPEYDVDVKGSWEISSRGVTGKNLEKLKKHAQDVFSIPSRYDSVRGNY